MTLCRPLNLQNTDYSIGGIRMPLADTHNVSSTSIQARIDARNKQIDDVKQCIAATKLEIKKLQKRGDFDSASRKGLNFKIHVQRKNLRGLLVEQDRDQNFKEAMERREAKNRETTARLYGLQK